MQTETQTATQFTADDTRAVLAALNERADRRAGIDHYADLINLLPDDATPADLDAARAADAIRVLQGTAILKQATLWESDRYPFGAAHPPLPAGLQGAFVQSAGYIAASAMQRVVGLLPRTRQEAQ